jgi:hypothetical protein
VAELVLGTLKHLWDTLAPLKLPIAVMGGLAVSFWKHVRATRDVDVLKAPFSQQEPAHGR